MISTVDKSDAGPLTVQETTDPWGWILPSFIMDPRSGLGRFKNYRISNHQLMDDSSDTAVKVPSKEFSGFPM